MAWTHPAYPTILTQKDWDKKKGVIAKMHGATGIGAQMNKCESLYKKIDWSKIEVGSNTSRSYNQFTMQGWKKVLDDAKKEINGNARAFVESLYKLRDLANKAAKDFKKSKTIPSSSTKHVEEIAKTADQLGVSLNANSLNSPIQKDWQEVIDENQKITDQLPKLLKKVLARTPGEISKLNADKSASNFNRVSMKAARDITQSLTNIVLCLEKRGLPVAGVQPNQLSNLKALSTLFTSWGNNSSFFKLDTDEAVVDKEIKKFELGYKKLNGMFG